jgi:hypothetical protein
VTIAATNNIRLKIVNLMVPLPINPVAALNATIRAVGLQGAQKQAQKHRTFSGTGFPHIPRHLINTLVAMGRQFTNDQRSDQKGSCGVGIQDLLKSSLE